MSEKQMYWLDPIPEPLREHAIKALDEGDPWFIHYASNTDGLALGYKNIPHLLKAGIYEKSLLDAYTGTRGNWSGYSTDFLLLLFRLADRGKLLALGDPLPDQETFTVYRGVAGSGKKRRVKGLSWTSSKEKAWWFATRYAQWLDNPAIYRAEIHRDDVFSFTNDRNESELVAWPTRLPTRCSNGFPGKENSSNASPS